MSSFIPSVSIPSKNNLWLNLDSTKSILSWYKSIYERRKKMKKLKENSYKLKNSKKKGNMFNLIVDQDADYESKEWRKTYFEFSEENLIEEDEICTNDDDNDDNIFRLFVKKSN
jgi:hypothetical protein